jgi:hypothetical protein
MVDRHCFRVYHVLVANRHKDVRGVGRLGNKIGTAGTQP